MGKGENQSNEDVEILEKLKVLEEKIKNCGNVQKQLKMVSLVGVFLIFSLTGLFIYRLYDYFASYDYMKVMEEVKVQAKDAVEPEIDLFLVELRTDLLPKFFDHLVVKFKESSPEIKESGFQLVDNLERGIKERAEERLLNSLITSIEKSGEEIQEIFPEFSADELEKQIGKSIDYYIEKLHDSMEERVFLMSASLTDLKNTVETVGSSVDLEFQPKSSGEAEEQLLDALLDLIIYEIKPEMGIELAVD